MTEHSTHHDHPDRGGVSEAGWRRIAAWARETADVAKLNEPAIPDNLGWLSLDAQALLREPGS